MKNRLLRKFSAAVAVGAVAVLGALNVLPQAQAATTYTVEDVHASITFSKLTYKEGANAQIRTSFNDSGSYLPHESVSYFLKSEMVFPDLSRLEKGDIVRLPIAFDQTLAYVNTGSAPVIPVEEVITVDGVDIFSVGADGQGLFFTALVDDISSYKNVATDLSFMLHLNYINSRDASAGAVMLVGSTPERVTFYGTADPNAHVLESEWDGGLGYEYAPNEISGFYQAEVIDDWIGHNNRFLRDGTKLFTADDQYVQLVCVTADKPIYTRGSYAESKVFDYSVAADGYLGYTSVVDWDGLTRELVDTRVTNMDEAKTLQAGELATTQVNANKICIASNHGSVYNNPSLWSAGHDSNIKDAATKNLHNTLKNAGMPATTVETVGQFWPYDTTTNTVFTVETETCIGGACFSSSGSGSSLPFDSSASGEQVRNVTFDNNGGSGRMQVLTGVEGSKVTLPANTFTRTGYTFMGWNTKADGTGTKYANRANFTYPANDTTLYAQWKQNVVRIDPQDPDYVKVTFDPKTHGTITSGIADLWVLKVATVTLEAPTVKANEGWTFTGWDKGFTKVKFSVDTVINARYLPFIHPVNEDGEAVPGDIHDGDGNDTSDTPLDPDDVEIVCADGSDTCGSLDNDGNLVIPDDENGNPPTNVDITTEDTDGDGDIDKITVDVTYPDIITVVDDDGKTVPSTVTDKDGNDTSKTPVDDDATVTCVDGSDCADIDKNGVVTVHDDDHGNPPTKVTITTEDTDGDGVIDKVTVDPEYPNTVTPLDEDGDPVPGDIHDGDGNDTSDTPLDPDDVEIVCADGSDTCGSLDNDGNLVIPDDENGNPPTNVDITTEDTDGDGDIDKITVDPEYPQVDTPDSHTKRLEVNGKIEVGKELTMDEPSEVAGFVDRHLVKDAASGDVRLASIHYTGKKVGKDSFEVAYWVDKVSGSPDYIVTYNVEVTEKAAGKSGVSTRGLSSTGAEVGGGIALTMLLLGLGSAMAVRSKRRQSVES